MARQSKRILAVITALCIILAAVFTGCGTSKESDVSQQNGEVSSSEKSTSAVETTKVEEPYAFSVFRATWTELDDQTDPVILELNKKLNIKIKVLTSPYETRVEKYNVLMSSGETPDLSCINGPGLFGYNQWAEQGKYVDLTDIYPKYPNIVAKVPKGSFEAIKLKGKIYCIPKPFVYEDIFVFREDWLKNLNLTVPGTIDELYTVLKAFKDGDPDKNGKADTIPFSCEDSGYCFSYIFGAFGTYGMPGADGYSWYKTPENTISSTLLQAGTKDAIKFLAKLYKEKLLDQEWMVTKSQNLIDKYKAGKVGSVISTVSQLYQFESDMKKVDPSVSLDGITKITGSGGAFGKDLMLSYYMTNSISAKAANPQKIMEFLDYCLSDEGITLLRYGIENLTYTKDNGKIAINADAAKQYGLEGGHKFTWMMAPAEWAFPEDERGNKYKEMCKWFLDQQPALAPMELPSQKEISAKQGADIIQKQLTAMICGKVDIDKEWDKMISNWKETGGDQMLKEVNDAYNATK